MYSTSYPQVVDHAVTIPVIIGRLFKSMSFQDNKTTPRFNNFSLIFSYLCRKFPDQYFELNSFIRIRRIIDYFGIFAGNNQVLIISIYTRMLLKTSFSKKEHTDSGLALLLLTLIVGQWVHQPHTVQIAIAEVLILLIAPVLLFPFTFLWLNISDLLGKVMSKIILSIVFFVFVWPVSLIRRAMGKDTLNLKKFKKDTNSVFINRNHTYTRTDLTTPY